MTRDYRKKRGLALAMVLVILFVLSVLGFALGARGTVGLQQVYISRQQTMAYYAAQSGIMLAIEAEQQSDANLPINYCGGSGGSGASTNIVSSDSSLPAGAVRLSSLQGITLPATFPNNSSYSITITDNSAPSSGCGTNATAPDGTLVPPGKVYITSKGTSQGRTKVSNVMVPVTPGTSGTPSVDFNYGAFAASTITVSNGASINSYNSANGAYGGSNVGTKGNIGSNADANATISISGGSTISGTVNVGPGGTAGSPTISNIGGSSYSSAAVLSSSVSMPTVTAPSGMSSPGSSSTTVTCNWSNTCSPALATGGDQNYGNLTTNGGFIGSINAGNNTNYTFNNVQIGNGSTVTFGCGNYYMNSINVNGGSTVIINCPSSSGTAKFYVAGNSSSGNFADGAKTTPVDFSNGAITNTQGGVQVPSQFQIYDLSTATSCNGGRCNDDFAGGTSTALVLYAPNSNITLSNGGTIYGSLIGNSITDSGGTTIHYDQSLSSIPIGQASSSTPAVVGNFTVWNFQ